MMDAHGPGLMKPWKRKVVELGRGTVHSGDSDQLEGKAWLPSLPAGDFCF